MFVHVDVAAKLHACSTFTILAFYAQLYTTHLMQESLRLWKDMGTQWQTAGQQQDTKEVRRFHFMF